MTSWDELDRAVRGRCPDDVLACDALLDRLGQREPVPVDLDDPVVASLALLAGDVDLRPVPVEAIQDALVLADTWPLEQRNHDADRFPSTSAPAEPADLEDPAGPTELVDLIELVELVDRAELGSGVGAGRSRRELTIVLPRTTSESAPTTSTTDPDDAAPAANGRGGRSPRGRRAGELLAGRPTARRHTARWARAGRAAHALDARPDRPGSPRVLRLRATVGLAAAAGLVLLGGGLGLVALTTGDDTDPIGGVVAAMHRWGDGGEPVVSRHDDLDRKIEAARALIRTGRLGEAAQILHDVRRRVFELPPAERVGLLTKIGRLERLLPSGDGGSSGGTPTATASGDLDRVVADGGTWTGTGATSPPDPTVSAASGASPASGASSDATGRDAHRAGRPFVSGGWRSGRHTSTSATTDATASATVMDLTEPSTATSTTAPATSSDPGFVGSSGSSDPSATSSSDSAPASVAGTATTG